MDRLTFKSLRKWLANYGSWDNLQTAYEEELDLNLPGDQDDTGLDDLDGLDLEESVVVTN